MGLETNADETNQRLGIRWDPSVGAYRNAQGQRMAEERAAQGPLASPPAAPVATQGPLVTGPPVRLGLGGTTPPSQPAMPLLSDPLGPMLQQYAQMASQPMFQGLGQTLQAGLSGAAVALQGGQGNPMLEAAGVQRDRELKHKLETIKLQQDVEARRDRQTQAAMTFYGTLAQSDSPDARRMGWTSLLALGEKQYGLKTPPGLADSLSIRPISPEDLTAVVADIDANVPPEVTIKNHPNVSREAYEYAKQIQGSDQARMGMKIPTKADYAKKQLEADKVTEENLLRRFGIHGDSVRSQYVLREAVTTYGKTFDQLSADQQRELVKKSAVVVTPLTTITKEALEEKYGRSDITDPVMIQKAVTEYRARRQHEALVRAATQGQLTQMGSVYRNELNRVTVNLDRLKNLDILADDAERLIAEGKKLGLTDNPAMLNTIMQELASWTGGPLSKSAEWVRAFAILDARYASVAQGLEQISGNRLAQTLAQKALGFHPRIADPWSVQSRMVNEMRAATRKARDAADSDLASIMRQYQAATAQAGVPFVLGGPLGEADPEGWSGSPSPEAK